MPAAKKGPNAFRVVGPVAVIRKDRHERYVYRGGLFFAKDIDADNAEHLVGLGLIEPHDLPVEAEPEASGE